MWMQARLYLFLLRFREGRVGDCFYYETDDWHLEKDGIYPDLPSFHRHENWEATKQANKSPQQAVTANPKEVGESDFWNCYIIICQTIQFPTKKAMKHAKRHRKYGPVTRKQWRETVHEEALWTWNRLQVLPKLEDTKDREFSGQGSTEIAPGPWTHLDDLQPCSPCWGGDSLFLPESLEKSQFPSGCKHAHSRSYNPDSARPGASGSCANLCVILIE